MIKSRIQYIEIHDQPWCPPAIRDGATACLNVVANIGRQYSHILPLIQDALNHSDTNRIIDLGSGGGGPWRTLARRLAPINGQPVHVLLTDLFPNQTIASKIRRTTRNPENGARIDYEPTPVDATRVPHSLTGVRTLFTLFHHFPPHTARQILQDAVDQRQSVAIFEQTRRSPLALLIMLLLPWIAFLVVPLIRPFRWSRLFWTYVFPAIPFVLCHDGIVSCLRTYSLAEMQSLITELEGGESYRWVMGRAPSPLSPLGVLFVVGYPDVVEVEREPRVARTK